MRKSWVRLVAGLIFAAVGLAAATLKGHYVVEYGIFGKMGEAEATLMTRDGRYTIEMKAWATGLAKILSRNRVETYRSEGRIVAGRFVPDRFSKDIRRANKRRIKVYRFDHPHRIVRFQETKYRDGRRILERNETLPYYAKDDIFSLYFNIRQIIPDCNQTFDRYLHAVGAEKQTGRIRVETLRGDARKEAKILLGEVPCYLRVTIFQKLFGSKGGNLYLGMRDNGIADRAILKDVVMFGDVRGRLTHLDQHE